MSKRERNGGDVAALALLLVLAGPRRDHRAHHGDRRPAQRRAHDQPRCRRHAACALAPTRPPR